MCSISFVNVLLLAHQGFFQNLLINLVRVQILPDFKDKTYKNTHESIIISLHISYSPYLSYYNKATQQIKIIIKKDCQESVTKEKSKTTKTIGI